jgi:predicted DNA-binding protein with PD1-like motif
VKYSEARPGRVFVIRLEDGDVVHESIEKFARETGVRAAALVILGGADTGSRLVVGPEDGRVSPVVPMVRELTDVHEVAGTGTLFPDEDGTPLLHMHMACGREGETRTGCVREGVRVWQVMEAIVFEIADTSAARVMDPSVGLKLLRP